MKLLLLLYSDILVHYSRKKHYVCCRVSSVGYCRLITTGHLLITWLWRRLPVLLSWRPTSRSLPTVSAPVTTRDKLLSTFSVGWLCVNTGCLLNHHGIMVLEILSLIVVSFLLVIQHGYRHGSCFLMSCIFSRFKILNLKVLTFIKLMLKSSYKKWHSFSALTLLVGQQKGIRPVKKWVVGCWCGYVSESRCRFAYHCLLLQ